MGNRKKTYLKLGGFPILIHALAPFERSKTIDDIVLVVAAGDEWRCLRNVVIKYGLKKVRAIVTGGAERQDSVANGLEAISAHTSVVAVHDGARPLVTQKIVEDSVIAARRFGAAIAAVPVKDTIKTSKNMFVDATLPRHALYGVQTPQTFKAAILKAAHKRARAKGILTTDESSLVELTGKRVRIVEGSYENIKITTEEDLHLAKIILKSRAKSTKR